MLLSIIILLVVLVCLIVVVRTKKMHNATVEKLKAEIAEKTAEIAKLVKQIATDKDLLEAVQEDLTTAKEKYNELEGKFTDAVLDSIPEPPDEGSESTDEDTRDLVKRETAITVLYDGPIKKKQGKLVCSCCGGSVGGRGKVNYCSWCGAEIEFADKPETKKFTE